MKGVGCAEDRAASEVGEGCAIAKDGEGKKSWLVAPSTVDSNGQDWKSPEKNAG